MATNKNSKQDATQQPVSRGDEALSKLPAECDDKVLAEATDEPAEAEGADGKAFVPDVLAKERGPGIHVYNPDDLVKLAASQPRSSTDPDVRSRNRGIIVNLSARGSFRPLFRIPTDWEQRFDELERDYPHFRQAWDYMRACCVLAVLDNGVLELDPILFEGPPGTGKSTLSEILDGLLGSGYHRVSMSAAESGALIGGSQETWANSRPGVVFDALTDGDYANPIIVVDEIDKTSSDHRFDPMGPLYQLLEPATARHFVDLSVPRLPLNASRIVWIATSNDARMIPAPIRQRLVQFDIPVPTAEQARNIVRSVIARLHRERPRLRQFTLADETIDAFVGLSPRQVRKAIPHACALAVTSGRRVVLPVDIRPDASEGRRIGY